MTDEEYKSICEQIAATFPMLHDWMRRLAPAAREAQRDLRRRLLIDLDHRDVTSAIVEFSTLAVSPWAEYGGEERAAQRIAAKAREFSAKRATRAEASKLIATSSKYSRGKYTATIWEMAEELRKRRQQPDWSPTQEADWFAEKLGPQDETDLRDAVTCRDCRDTGLVTCLNQIKWAKDRAGGQPFIVHTTMVLACRCQEGQKHSGVPQNPMREYDETAFIKISPTATGKEAAAALEEWRRTTAEKKRYTGFDEYNRRATQPSEAELNDAF